MAPGSRARSLASARISSGRVVRRNSSPRGWRGGENGRETRADITAILDGNLPETGRINFCKEPQVNTYVRAHVSREHTASRPCSTSLRPPPGAPTLAYPRLVKKQSRERSPAAVTRPCNDNLLLSNKRDAGAAGASTCQRARKIEVRERAGDFSLIFKDTAQSEPCEWDS